MVKKNHPLDRMTIGQISKRVGIPASAIRFYEDQGLIRPERDRAGQRIFRRTDLRKLSFVKIAQNLGFPLARIQKELSGLPENRPPTAKDWAAISADFGRELDERIATMIALRDKLEGCIGCGCLSMENCALYNPDDAASRLGSGPRYLLGDSAVDVT